jgi:hypothetical protein
MTPLELEAAEIRRNVLAALASHEITADDAAAIIAVGEEDTMLERMMI